MPARLLTGALGDALTAGLELARRDPGAQRIATAARVGPADSLALGRAARRWERARRRALRQGELPEVADVHLLAVLRLCSPELLELWTRLRDELAGRT